MADIMTVKACILPTRKIIPYIADREIVLAHLHPKECKEEMAFLLHELTPYWFAKLMKELKKRGLQL